MKGLRNAIAGLGLAGLLAVSGCGITIPLKPAPYIPRDLRGTAQALILEKRADELAGSSSLDDLGDAVKIYGSVGKLEKMDKVLDEIAGMRGEDEDEVINYIDIGRRCNEMYERIDKKKK
ncbi:MAG: hypothetical protein PHH54_00815 [Candidatus Nanoarchaeia archaeon]|nr:hypothetical protein [Candidatus Nanoarchaeia archaeon]MDD5740504.1 hypothetical protein [Candidatus Nanoarchaeia archaeon]